MIHLTLPPFDYISQPPYIASIEAEDGLFDATAYDTLFVAVLQLFFLPEHGVRRLVDARGVTILGVDGTLERVNVIGVPPVVATNEALRILDVHLPTLTEKIEIFEMWVRDVYVHLKGGT